ncbi:adenosylmethionine--8-amino-7-oxononanoate transaminase [Aurantivibrio plasticivorans]
MHSTDLEFDRDHIWHPYTSTTHPLPVYPVDSASGVTLKLTDGRELIDGMSSWWCAIHGYNNARLNSAAHAQIEKMSHIMFGGITHQPAVDLVKKLLALSPPHLQKVFLADSGSVSVEVACKMAFQYQVNRDKPLRQKLLTLRGGYHGDTLGAMSVCDPVTGMHTLFNKVLPQHIFADKPSASFHSNADPQQLLALDAIFEQRHEEIAAVIIEPIVQGAGGMWFYSPDYLRHLRVLCDQYDVLLIADEIATGFGRTGKMFACEHAGVDPDIVCLGKAITGGYMTLAATLTSDKVADGICAKGNVMMHGPTFMGNPLACAVACASIDELLANDWQRQVHDIENQLNQELAIYRQSPNVHDVRVLGAVGVVELVAPVDVAKLQSQFVDRGVWIRPFGKNVYLMPPYIIKPEQLSRLCDAISVAL